MISSICIENYRNFKGKHVFDFDFNLKNREHNLTPLIVMTENFELYRNFFHAIEKFVDLKFYYECRDSFIEPPPPTSYNDEELDHYETNQTQTLSIELYLDGNFYTGSFTVIGNHLLKYEFTKNSEKACTEKEIENYMLWLDACFNMYDSVNNLTIEGIRFYNAPDNEKFLKKCKQADFLACDILKDNNFYNAEILNYKMNHESQKIYLVYNFQLKIPDFYMPSNIYYIKSNKNSDAQVHRYSQPVLKKIKKPNFKDSYILSSSTSKVFHMKKVS